MIICDNGYPKEQPILDVLSVLKGVRNLAKSVENQLVGAACVALVVQCFVGRVAVHPITNSFIIRYRNGLACTSRMLAYGRWVCDYVWAIWERIVPPRKPY